MKYLRKKDTGWKYRILGPEDFEGYEQNRPGPKWELVEVPQKLRNDYGGRDQVWMPNNPEFVEEIEDGQL